MPNRPLLAEVVLFLIVDHVVLAEELDESRLDFVELFQILHCLEFARYIGILK